jgi:ankyrin repeat protein
MHGLEALDRDILLISEPETLTVMSFLSASPSPTTYNMSGAGRPALAALLRCARRLGHPLSRRAAARGRSACTRDLPAPHAPSRCTARSALAERRLRRPHLQAAARRLDDQLRLLRVGEQASRGRPTAALAVERKELERKRERGSGSGSAGSVASGNSNAPGPRLLARAAEAGDTQLVARLLGEGRDVNEADESGYTALFLASQNGHVEVVRLLLARKGVKVNKTAQNGATALMVASLKGHVEVVRLLLARKDVEVNKSEEDGYTALTLASYEGHVEVVRLLLAHQGVEVNKTTPNGDTALIFASQNGHVDVVQILLARQGVEVNKTTLEGWKASRRCTCRRIPDTSRWCGSCSRIRTSRPTGLRLTAGRRYLSRRYAGTAPS